MAKCPTCGTPVNLAPAGDLKYDPRGVRFEEGWLRRQVDRASEIASRWPAWLTRPDTNK